MTNPTKEPVTNPTKKYQVWVVGADGVVKVTFWNLEAEAARDMVAACLSDCDQGATLSVRLMAKAEEALAGEARRVTYGEVDGAVDPGMTRDQSGNWAWNSNLGSDQPKTRMTSQARIRATAKELAGQWPEAVCAPNGEYDQTPPEVVRAKLLAGQWTEGGKFGCMGNGSDDQSRN